MVNVENSNQGGAAANLSTQCLQFAVEHYLKPSGDFNGLPLDKLAVSTGAEWSALQGAVAALVQGGSANVHWTEVDGNPHINRHGFAPPADQLEHLRCATSPSRHCCLFPGREALAKAVVTANFSGRPYTLELALGAGQLAFRSFEVQVLENYRNDPRYSYTCSDVGGNICISTEGSEGTLAVKESDRVLLQTFGFSYDDQRNRYVAVFLRYLHGLSSEHQLIWRAREVTTPTKLHPDYYRSTVLGSWDLSTPLLEALCMEIWLINKMTLVMRGRALFKGDFGKYAESRPRKLALLIRPTLEEYNAGVHLLDKVLSDNLSHDFFRGLVDLETERERDDGRIEVTQKGTLALLDDWMRKTYRTTDWSPWDEAIASLKKVRRLRQKPAHALHEDVFDPRYARDFAALCADAYQALATLRGALQRHPDVQAAGISVPQNLQDGKVWTA